MFLFAISFILIFVSSYFISSVLAKNKFINCFIYTNLIAFAQIVVTSEILSIFTQIKEVPFLCINLIFLIISLIVWLKSGKPVPSIQAKNFLKKLFNTLRLDKSLILLSLGWIFFICVSLFLIISLPVTSADAMDYHVTRIFDWIINSSLAHVESADIRMNAFPINSELLYMWIVLFTKKMLFLGMYSFVGYILFLISGYGIFKYIGYSTRRTLWTFLMISSFASVVVMISGTETDLIVAGLITTSIYLFLSALKNKSDNIFLFMSSLAYALAVGVKTPAIICIPAIGILYIVLSFKYRDKYSLLKFLTFGLLNFIIVSSYNYILNFIDYENFMGSSGSISEHENNFGFRGFVSGFIKHLFLLIDFSGIKLFEKIAEILPNVETKILKILHVYNVPNGVHCGNFYFNISLIEPGMGCGILSFLMIIPCWLVSLVSPLFKNRRFNRIQCLFALIFLINLILLSSLIIFMTYSTRFLTCFILVSAPMLACSYIKSNKNPVKYFLVFIAVFYFTLISTHLWSRPFFKLVNTIKTNNLKEYRSKITCFRFDKRIKKLDEWCNINALLDSKFANPDYKVLFMPNFSQNLMYTKLKKLKGYKYSYINAEHLKDINPDVFDIIVVPKDGQATTQFDKYTPDKIDYYFTIDHKSGKYEYYPLDINSELVCYYKSISGTMSKELNNVNNTPNVKLCKLTNKFFEHHPFAFAYQTQKYYILLNTNKFPEFRD